MCWRLLLSLLEPERLRAGVCSMLEGLWHVARVGVLGGALCAQVTFSARHPDSPWQLYQFSTTAQQIPIEVPWDLGQPVWVPSAAPRQIIFTDSAGRLLRITPGTSQPPETISPRGLRCSSPQVTWDGKSVVFIGYRFQDGAEDSDIYIRPLEPGAQGTVLIRQTGIQEYPAMAPDGHTLVYTSSTTISVRSASAIVNQVLWIADLNSGSARPLLAGPAHDTKPAWSPTGDAIVFSSDRAGTPDLWLTDASGRTLTRLTRDPGAESSPVFSPDGTEILYVSAEAGRTELRVLTRRTGRVRRLDPFPGRAVEIRDPDWR